LLDRETFRCVVAHAPLVSVDLIVRRQDDGAVLLGRRVNEPAKGQWFTTGGRVFKNETIDEAQQRLAREELGLETLPGTPQFLGVFEHFYDNAVFEGVTTHYVNLAYWLFVDALASPPRVQHDGYRWFSIDELLAAPDVHPYVKNYFKKDHHGR